MEMNQETELYDILDYDDVEKEMLTLNSSECSDESKLLIDDEDDANPPPAKKMKSVGVGESEAMVLEVTASTSPYRCWWLSDRCSIRVGVSDGNKVTVRISTQDDLTEKRPLTPSSFLLFEGVEDDKSLKSKPASTLFMTADEAVELMKMLEKKIDALNLKTPTTFKLNICSEERQNEINQELDAHPFSLHSVPTIKIRNKKAKLTTFKVAYGFGQMDQELIERGKVYLTEQELSALTKQSESISNHIQHVEKVHKTISSLVLKKAGITLSNLLYAKAGCFTNDQVLMGGGYLMRAFLKVYTEFTCMGYIDSLTSEIKKEVEYSTPNLLSACGIDLKTLISQILLQFDCLYTTQYISMPKHADESEEEEEDSSDESIVESSIKNYDDGDDEEEEEEVEVVGIMSGRVDAPFEAERRRYNANRRRRRQVMLKKLDKL
jgi:hypothetical protein